MKHSVKCPKCNCKFETGFNILQWQLSEAKRILNKSEEEMEEEWKNYYGWIGLENEKPLHNSST